MAAFPCEVDGGGRSGSSMYGGGDLVRSSGCPVVQAGELRGPLDMRTEGDWGIPLGGL